MLLKKVAVRKTIEVDFLLPASRSNTNPVVLNRGWFCLRTSVMSGDILSLTAGLGVEVLGDCSWHLVGRGHGYC